MEMVIQSSQITAGDIGPLYKIRISHDNSAEFAGWLCEEVTLQDIHTDEEFTFPCNKWLSTEEDDGEICRELPVTQYGQPVIPMCKYQVATVTGDYWNGGTDADVYITMYGEKGDTGPRHLHRSKRSNKFEKGQTDIFSVEAVSLGAIQKVVVGLTDTDPGHGWYLEKVIVMESPDAHDEFVFPCHRWLDEGEDDGKTVRELLLETKPPSVQALEKDMWALEKWKYDRGNTVLLYCKGTSKAVRVKADATVDANGDPDGTDPFSHFEVHRRKGNIRVFRSVMNPSYHLAVDHCKVLGQGKGGAYCEFRVRTHQDRSVSLESVKTPSQFVTFLANGRSGDTRGSSVGPSKQFVTYVKGMLRDAGVVVLHTSRIQVFVSDEDGACSASGKKSQRGYWKIHKVEEGGIRMLENVAFPSKFLRVKDGQCDCLGNGDEYCHFKVTKHKDKGFITLQSLKNRGIYAGFATSGIARPTVDTGERNVRFYPEVVQWGMKKGTDIVPSPRTPPLIIDDEPKKTTYLDGDWKIWLKSGKKGTKAPITFIAYGRKGPSDLLTLGKKGDTIAAGDETEFMINLGTITDMYKIRLGLQEENSWDDSWHLSQVRMQDMVSNEQLKFKVNRWLSRTEDDGDSLRELAVVKPGRKPLPMVRYFVQVYTGDEPGSDTDANVYICIYGDRGDTGKRLLHRSDISDKFQQGQVDSFEIEAISLGKPRKVVISHDGSGPGAGWFCQEVAIRDSKGSKTEYVFQCNKWLDEGLDDKKIERELKLTEIREIEPNDWLVWITTGREDSASTTAKVALYAYGSRSSSDAIVLGSGKDGYFYAGNIDKFKVNIGNIGDMYKIRIGHNNMYDEPAWFLEKVRMRDMNQGTMVTMNVNRWLSREHDDMDVWRELPMALPGKDLLPVLKYFIQVFTADLPKANTKSTIFMNIYGKRGDTGKRVLYKSKNNDEQFNINQVDIFEIEAVHLGELRKVVIGHDGKTPGEGWYLDKIIIKESQDSDNEVYFPCKKWLDRGKEDKKIDRELTPSKPIGEYTVIFTTGGASLDRNDALVCFDVYGEKAHAQPFIFGATKREYFSPDAKDQFEINVGEIGDIYKIRVSHDDHDKWEGWYLKEVRMIDRMKNDEYVYKFNRWLSRDEDDMDIVRELPTERRGKKTLPVLKYFVEVFTGINPNAATKANVYMNIYGKKGDCGKRILYKSHNNDEKFRREQRDVFEIEAVHLMDLKKIIIGHDGKAGGEGWFLDKVIIKESEDADSQWYFPCRKWLDTSKDDRKIERELKPGKPDHEWAVWITTADDSCQRNTAVGHIVMYGDKGKTEMIPLGAARSDKLAPGQSDEFEIQTGKIGKLYKIRIGYEDEDKWDGWHVNEVRMMERSSKEILTFSFDRWMSRSEDDNDIVRELPAVRDGEKTLPVIRYYVEVYTGDLDDASTQSSAYMTLYGKRGDTGVRALYKSMHNEDKFQRGQMDAFEIEAVHLGDIKHIIIGHDGVEPGQGWYVDHVVVKESEYAEQQWYFPCKRWFDVSRDDRKIERQIIPGEREYTPPPTPEPDEGWKLELTTADDSYPSHGAVAYISVYGNKRNSDRIPLSAFDSFTPGKTDKFDVSFEVNLGEIYKIRIEHDDKDKWEGWHLNEIKMRDNSSKEDYLYKFDRWLSRNKDDLDIVRELPTIKDGKDHLPVLKYYVEVFTGREPKAETNANVFMTIYGKKGDSGKRVLYKSMNNDVKFQREQRDVFVIEAVHLMDLKKVVIGHDGKVAGKGWFLDKVIIRESEDSDKDFYFPCRKWLDVGQDDKKIERELKVSKADYEYTVWITTSSESNPRNNALVHLVVYGSKGKSDPILLGSARQQTFSPGNTDEFEIYTGKVGEIYKIRVGYDDDTKWDGWHLSQVRMRDRVTHEYLQFDCNRWMSRTDDDLDIVRELPAERPGKDTLPGMPLLMIYI
uniref:Lipoxygenase homology domain-containing protein 1-like n=1 Tax=Saccoglossus kowalevskii TaxID=10224 RepID=A0ABM0M3L7_SACKO|nr:PREDICTED: lipoxygenase homology domain-containing protein 1-like [Saccoglossus kowalevskii]